MTAVQTKLLAEVLDLLRQLRPGTKRGLPLKHGEILVRRDFARNNAGALVIPTLGRAKLALEVTRASRQFRPA